MGGEKKENYIHSYRGEMRKWWCYGRDRKDEWERVKEVEDVRGEVFFRQLTL